LTQVISRLLLFIIIEEQENYPRRKSSVVSQQRTRVDAQKITKVKDELEYATNWRRAFNRIFTDLKWLNAYAEINEVALKQY